MTGQRTFFDSFQSGMVTVNESGQEVFLIVVRLDFDSSDRAPLRASENLRFQVPKSQNPSKIARCARLAVRPKAAKIGISPSTMQKVKILPK